MYLTFRWYCPTLGCCWCYSYCQNAMMTYWHIRFFLYIWMYECFLGTLRFQLTLCPSLSLSQRYRIHKMIKYAHFKYRAQLLFTYEPRYHYPGQGEVFFQHTKKYPGVPSIAWVFNKNLCVAPYKETCLLICFTKLTVSFLTQKSQNHYHCVDYSDVFLSHRSGTSVYARSLSKLLRGCFHHP